MHTHTLPRPELVDGLRPRLLVDFTVHCGRLRTARENQRRKDTPAHRAAVAGLLGDIDAVLDLYLAARNGAQQ